MGTVRLREGSLAILVFIAGCDWGGVLYLHPGDVLQVRQPLPPPAESHPPPQEHQEEDQGEEQESGGQAAILRRVVSEERHLPHHAGLHGAGQPGALHSADIHGAAPGTLYNFPICGYKLRNMICKPRKFAAGDKFGEANGR